MALLKTKTVKVFGENLVFESAYHQVTNISGSKSQLEFSVVIFKNNSKDIILTSENYFFTPSEEEGAARWDKQAYEYVKTLDEYADAIDA